MYTESFWTQFYYVMKDAHLRILYDLVTISLESAKYISGSVQQDVSEHLFHSHEWKIQMQYRIFSNKEHGGIEKLSTLRE